MENADAVVIGAGVVGLAIARALSMRGREVIILEATGMIGSETSSRNSEVIHAGIYYPQGSLMARLCLEGRQRLYAFCRDHDVTAKKCGKMIVATTREEIGKLAEIAGHARKNGVGDLYEVNASAACKMEPSLHCVGALISPSTGIIDSHAYMIALRGDAENAGAMIAFHAPVVSGRIGDGGIVLNVGGDQPMRLRCRTVINAAGLHAPALARSITGIPADRIPAAYFAKGSYFSLSGRSPFSRLIYPVPVPGGLGVHLTLDLSGQARFGPDVEWVETIDYTVDPARGDRFYEAIRRYWPGLPSNSLQPAYAGIRPKIAPADVRWSDFRIERHASPGGSALINLFGIESPGLTSSLALADHVANLKS